MFCKFTMALLKEHLPRTQESLEPDCLEHHGERSLEFCDWMKSLKFLFVNKKSWKSECPGNVIKKVCKNFKKGLHFDLV